MEHFKITKLIIIANTVIIVIIVSGVIVVLIDIVTTWIDWRVLYEEGRT